MTTSWPQQRWTGKGRRRGPTLSLVRGCRGLFSEASEKCFELGRALLLLLEHAVHRAQQARLGRSGNRLAGGRCLEQPTRGRATSARLGRLFGAFGRLGL